MTVHWRSSSDPNLSGGGGGGGIQSKRHYKPRWLKSFYSRRAVEGVNVIDRSRRLRWRHEETIT